MQLPKSPPEYDETDQDQVRNTINSADKQNVKRGVPFDFVPAFPSYAKAALPSVIPAGGMIYCTDDTGGAVPAFSDGANWRRVTDRNVIS